MPLQPQAEPPTEARPGLQGLSPAELAPGFSATYIGMALIATAEANFARNALGRSDIDAGGTRALRNVSSVAFGGPDLRTVYLGNLAGDRLATFDSPLAGAQPPHWLY
jgi:hypothetical protein